MKIKTDQDGFVVGYVIVGDMDGAEEWNGEIPEGFSAEDSRYWRRDGDTLVFDQTRKDQAEQAVAKQAELEELYAWFVWYDNQVMQYNRAVRLGEAFDRDMAEMDVEAKIKQAQIREIRGILEG